MSGDDEVEDWVLQAIQTGLMEAKMDQMQRVVVISRCTNRVFGPAQWKVRRVSVRSGFLPLAIDTASRSDVRERGLVASLSGHCLLCRRSRSGTMRLVKSVRG